MAEKKRLPRFQELKKVHVIGVGGTLMGAFAAYLKRRGIDVTGSDQNVYPPMSDVLRDAGVRLFSGYKGENLEEAPRPDLVVIGNVIQGVNPEAKAAIEGGFAYSSLPEAMEELLLRETRNLVVAGTHGKTTTSSLLAHTLVKCGRDPSYFIGGVSQDLPFSFHVSSVDPGRYFVLEGDEYDTAFWDKVPKFNHYLPDDAILTSIEFDHADIYPDLAAVKRAFDGLIDRIRPSGRLIACYDYEDVREAASRAKVPVIAYASDRKAKGARFVPGNIRSHGGLTSFEVFDLGSSGGKAVEEITFQLPGQHNVMNALAVWIECRELGIASSEIASALRAFRGIKRRQEVRGEVRGITVIDDFAHHPTAVRETLRALRAKYPGRRLVTVFEPRSATSRRKVFQKDYATAFGEADEVFISSPYDQTRIPAADQFSSEQLVGDLERAGKQAHLMGTIEGGVSALAQGARSGDVIAVLSNGGFGGFIPKLLEALKVEAPAAAEATR